MRLAVALLFGTIGYTLAYAGIKGGPNGQWARQPWILWTQAFAELGREVQGIRSGIPPGPAQGVPLPRVQAG